jgi:predicted AAA+ superfamily ATPase
MKGAKRTSSGISDPSDDEDDFVDVENEHEDTRSQKPRTRSNASNKTDPKTPNSLSSIPSIPSTEDMSTPTSTSYATKQKIKQLNNYECTQAGVNHLNILLIGEKGAGKSSLLSTFHRSLFQNHGEEPMAGIGQKRSEVS